MSTAAIATVGTSNSNKKRKMESGEQEEEQKAEQQVKQEQEEQQQEPARKKKKNVQFISKAKSFVFERDAVVAPVSGDTFRNARLSPVGYKEQRVLLKLKDGGDINKTFGVEDSKFGGINVQLSLSADEYASLTKLHDDMINHAILNRDTYFPGSTGSNELIKELATATVHRGKPRANGGNWPSSITVKVDDAKDLQLSQGGTRKCKVKDNDDCEYIEDVYSLKGYNWTRAVIELKSIFLQSKSFGISKRLRLLKVSKPADALEIPTDSDSDSD
jgi:hypothetical protein